MSSFASGQMNQSATQVKRSFNIWYYFYSSFKNNENVLLQEIGTSIAYAHANMSQMPIYERIHHWGHGGGDFVFVVKK